MLLAPSSIPTIAAIEPYTPLELAGRDIYISEGCQACHTQQVRPVLSEVKRYGEYSRAGEFVYDHPALWGSRRIGPDLAREGGRRSDSWHLVHFVWPEQASADTPMPSYWHLLNQWTDFEATGARLRAMEAIGVPYGDASADAPGRARAQALQVAGAAIEQAGGLAALQDSLGGAAVIDDAQDLSERRIIALIAYLQRLGVDLSKAPAGGAASAGGVQ
jgi:cytochrome c oxidase cbb3-type subunit I/II